MQNHPKRDPVICMLYETQALGMQAYSIKQQDFPVRNCVHVTCMLHEDSIRKRALSPMMANAC